MVKINKSMLPIKAHFFFFMAAMGPILPQLSVIGKQIGIEPEVMGYITAILPILYVLAKPIIGFVADYFSNFRKLVFLILIISMTLAFAGFYFIPATEFAETALVFEQFNFELPNLKPCPAELLTANTFCSSMRRASCQQQNESTFDILFSLNDSKLFLDLSDNVSEWPNLQNICSPDVQADNTTLIINSSCSVSKQAPEESCLYGSPSFWWFIVLLFVGSIGFNVTNSISDAICFDMLGDTKINKYGSQRVWGTIGFGVTALLGGILVNYWTIDAVKSFTPALLIMLIFSGLDVISVSQLQLPKLSTSESIFKDVWKLVKQPAISTFLAFATIAGIIDSFIIFFLFWHLEEVAAATGYMRQIKLIEGCVVAAECLAGEVPFFFYSGKIIKKMGYINCMSMCFFFYAVRLALISWIPNPWYLVVVELFFQGITYALCYTCIVAYASAVAPPGTSATVQGLMAGMDDGLGFSIGSLIGGLSFKRYGGRRSFFYFSVLAIVTCAAHIFIRTSTPKKSYSSKTEYHVPKEQINLDVDNLSA